MSDSLIERFSTVFLDRDGVINYKVNGYVTSYNDFDFIDGAIESICKLDNIFDNIIIVTNQQGIGKKLMTVIELNQIHHKMMIEINCYGGRIDKIYYCPHIISDNCNCRKPKTGMIKKAKQDFPNIDFNRSFLVGDSTTDMQAARFAGIEFIKISEKYSLLDWTDSILID